MNYEYHPLANIFPLIEGQAFDDLVDDVRKNGVREPLWMYQNQILDGRNRYRAAKEAGVKCELRTYDGDDPVGFVVSLNLHRRHLTESQRAMVAAKLANMGLGDNKGAHRPSEGSANLQTLPGQVSQSDAAKLLNVSTRTVAAAAKVKDEAIPELVEAVERGEVSVSAAAAVATLAPEHQKEIIQSGKHAVQEKAKEIRQKPKPQLASAQPVATEHVLFLITQMDVIARHLERNGMDVESMVARFLDEVDQGNQVIAERLAVSKPIMSGLGKIADALMMEGGL